MKKIASLLLLLLLLSPTLWAKDHYRITLTIEGNNDSMLVMGRYIANTNGVVDTAWRDRKGRFVFSGEKELAPGMYFFANKKGTYVEFVIYNEKPFFDFSTKEENWTAHLKVKGSKENEFLCQFNALKTRMYEKMDAQYKVMDSVAFGKYARQCRQTLESQLDSITDAQPDRMISKMRHCARQIMVPEADSEGFKLSDRQRFDYLMEHYFDNYPLDDPFLFYTPKWVFYEPVMRYFDHYLKETPPDYICRWADTLIERTRPAKATFQWLVGELINKYLKSPIMVYDSVYVHLSRKYIVSGEAWWVEPSTINEEAERVAKWEKLLVGKVAPELILFDTLHNAHSLHYMPADYKLLIFWSPTCGHCKTVIPALYQKFEQFSQKCSISAFAILSEPDDHTRKLWKKFMNEKGINHLRWINLDGGEANVDWHEVYDVTTTPQIYLLDSENKILAKKLNADTFEMVMNALLKEGVK